MAEAIHPYLSGCYLGVFALNQMMPMMMAITSRRIIIGVMARLVYVWKTSHFTLLINPMLHAGACNMGFIRRAIQLSYFHEGI